jgi:hypothetical protein
MGRVPSSHPSREFAGFDEPWALLGDRAPDLVVDEVAMGGGWVAGGSVTGADVTGDPQVE